MLPYQLQAAGVSQQEVDCNKREKKSLKVFQIRAGRVFFYMLTLVCRAAHLIYNKQPNKSYVVCSSECSYSLQTVLCENFNQTSVQTTFIASPSAQTR